MHRHEAPEALLEFIRLYWIPEELLKFVHRIQREAPLELVHWYQAPEA
jgi:hypothetical protein